MHNNSPMRYGMARLQYDSDPNQLRLIEYLSNDLAMLCSVFRSILHKIFRSMAYPPQADKKPLVYCLSTCLLWKAE